MAVAGASSLGHAVRGSEPGATNAAASQPGKLWKVDKAVGNGLADATTEIQKAIDAAGEAGGGVVDVEEGSYVCGPMTLKNGVELRLEKGAALLMKNDIATWPMMGAYQKDPWLPKSSYENWISGTDLHDVAITGEGVIDGRGQPWWDKWRKRAGFDAAKELPHRPHMIVLKRCKGVKITGVTLKDSSNFHLVPEDCDNVLVEDVKIHSPEKAPNTDGIDPSGLHHVYRRLEIDVGDDNIAIKPQHARKDGHVSVEDFLVEDCVFKHGHGMSIGGQTLGGLKGLVVRRCTFGETEAGVRLKAGRGTGGLTEDCVYEDLTMKDVKVPVLITSYYPSVPAKVEEDPAQPVAETTPRWRGIVIRHVTATGARECGRVVGTPELPVEKMVMENVKLEGEKGFSVVNGEVEMKGCEVKAASGENVHVGRGGKVE